MEGSRCSWHAPAPNVTGLILATSGTSVTLSWSSDGGTTDGYQIAYTTGSTPPSNAYSGSVITAATVNGAASYTITGLAPGTTYSFLVSSESEAGGLSLGASSSVTTPALVSIAVTPASNSITAGNSQQMTATGTFSDNSTGNITALVTWSTSGGSGSITVNSSGLCSTTSGVADSTTVTATLGAIMGSTTLSTLNGPPSGTIRTIAGGGAGDHARKRNFR